MSQTTIKGGGAFTAKNISDLNANFTELYAGSTGGSFSNPTLTGTVSVTGPATFSTAASFTGAVTMSSAVALTGAVTLSSAVSFTGAATFSSAASFTGAVSMSSAVTVSGAATFSSAATFTGTTTLSSGVAQFTETVTGGALKAYGWSGISASTSDGLTKAYPMAPPTAPGIQKSIPCLSASSTGGAAAVTLTPSGTYLGSNTVATFSTTGFLQLIAQSTARWAVVANSTTVTFS